MSRTQDFSILNLLIITRHFPPEVSGGVRRWLELSKALANLGHNVTVVAPDFGDNNQKTAQHYSFSIIRVPHPAAKNAKTPNNQGISTPASVTTKFKDLVRQYVRVPDPDIGWAKRVVRTLISRQKENSFDWIITSAPPESLHYVGFRLKGRLAKYWLVDIRDYWLEYPLIEIRKRSFRRHQETRLAHRWLSSADVITAVDEGMANEAHSLSGLSASVLRNFSPANPDINGTVEFLGPKDSIRLLHTGSFSLSDLNRSILPVLEAFENASKVNSKISLHLIGRLTDDEIDLVRKCSSTEHIYVYGAKPAAVTLSSQKAAAALILTAAPNSPSVPGKISEYANAKRPIILIGDGPWRSGLRDLPSGSDAMIKAANDDLNVPDIKIETAADAAMALSKQMTNYQA